MSGTGPRADFVPGPRPGIAALSDLLDMFGIGLFLALGTERREGVLARIETVRIPKSQRVAFWMPPAGGVTGGSVRGPNRLKWLWLEGDETPVGFCTPYVLHEARVGDRVALNVQPHNGWIRRLRNLDRRRRWWQY